MSPRRSKGVNAAVSVITAEDGFEAMAEVEKKIPDLISLDLVMPRKSGAKFYRELSRDKRWAKIPIIIVTGHAQDDLGKADLRELTMSGPGVYLEKPVRPDNYIAAVKKILGMEHENGLPTGDHTQLKSETGRVSPRLPIHYCPSSQRRACHFSSVTGKVSNHVTAIPATATKDATC